MLARSRFIVVLVVGALLAVLSFSLQYLHLIPTNPVAEQRSLGKSRKRVNPVLHTDPPAPDPIRDTHQYCNYPNLSEHGWEGHSPADYRLLSVQVMIRHGDRFPLYSIPKTKKPAIDCTLSEKRKPSHPLLAAFINHMALGGRGHWDASLGSLPRLPNHNTCEMGELTQTGVVQHLKNGDHFRQAYIKRHNLLSADWSPRQVWMETTGKSRTLQSGLAFLFGFLPHFDWSRLTVRQQWSTLFCGSSCDCPTRNRYLDQEQRRQYHQRTADTELERTYVTMAKTLGVATKILRAANPVDALLCHFCHGLPFPCSSSQTTSHVSDEGACLTLQHFAVIRRQQKDDELERREAGLYRRYAVLAAHPYLNRTAARLEKIARGSQTRKGTEEAVFALASAHDVTMAPLLSALGLEGAGFPRFAARLVFELWSSPEAKDKERKNERKRGKWLDDTFIRVLYNGEDLTFDTAFCHDHNRHSAQPLCPLGNFLSFVRKDMFNIVNATSYQQACRQIVL
ncbi:2-phosphoxylose phosphatase 1 isoform X2 [Pimephales promelas]|uniref:2-phosphoxylose phosphatase 1 isoform X2 n=1 Tax=Pimephales promelas TaxID=90988 RepID=UPI001955D3A5|nr:2-phosphoxylose phosphatase 1 isoform X2 [Pimephales promelas]KAG1948268.1 2-phosphoxylose phosphatase [Pimephales promelas]